MCLRQAQESRLGGAKSDLLGNGRPRLAASEGSPQVSALHHKIAPSGSAYSSQSGDHASRRVVHSLSSQSTTVAFTPSPNTNCTTAGDFKPCRMETTPCVVSPG